MKPLTAYSRYYDKYKVLPEDVRAALLEDMVWITPAGVSVENPIVTLEPKKLTWKKTYGNTETAKTVDGCQLAISARIVASLDAKSGDVIIKMVQFNTLELANLYVVRIDAFGAQIVEDADVYMVTQVE